MLFDDARGRWGPLCRWRPVFSLRSGAHTTWRRIERRLHRAVAALYVAEPLVEVVRQRHRNLAVQVLPEDEHWLLINGRWLGVDGAEAVGALRAGEALVDAKGTLIAAHVHRNDAQALAAGGWRDLPDHITTRIVEGVPLIERPWHVLDQLDRTLRDDLDALGLPIVHRHAPPGVTVVGEHPVKMAHDVRVIPPCTINATAGAVAVDEGATLHPFTALEGPCYIGEQTVLAAHTSIRPWTVVGPRCKVGGEVSGAILHGCTNKAHLGYLGNSLVGAWCNLGADTNVSNLKNTYGPVRVQLEADTPPEDTGRQFHGPIIGDFVRTAIGTRLLTGSCLDLGCMIACSGLAPKHAAPLGFYTDAPDGTPRRAEHDVDRLIATIHRMMARRQVTLTDAERQRLRDLAQPVAER